MAHEDLQQLGTPGFRIRADIGIYISWNIISKFVAYTSRPHSRTQGRRQLVSRMTRHLLSFGSVFKSVKEVLITTKYIRQ